MTINIEVVDPGIGMVYGMSNRPHNDIGNSSGFT